MFIRIRLLIVALLTASVITAWLPAPGACAEVVSPDVARQLAKEAYIYGFPLVDSYRIQHAYFVDRNNPEFKNPWNEIRNIPRVFTPDDKAVQTPNSDTPYSMLGLDLRSEPMVLTIPAIPQERYFSVQLIDAYTFNFAYIGSRATGNGGGHFLVAGPQWKGELPKGVSKLIRSETNFVLAAYRTQLFNAGDLENVKQVQAGYQVRPLSAFLGKAAPAAAPAVKFIKPLTPEQQKGSIEFFNVLSFVLQFCPTHPSEVELMSRLAKINVGAGKSIEADKLAPEMKKAIQDGMADAWQALEGARKEMDAGRITSGDAFGTREHLKNNYLYRMLAAVVGIYGNSKDEAVYPILSVDSAGKPLSGAKRYALRFPPGEFPPVNAFWSLTMYEMPSSLLVANRLNRYLINSPMLPGLKRDADGGLTLYVQHDSPGADRESNWLPAPNGPFLCVMRLYWPKEEVVGGKWKPPALELKE